MKKLLETTEFSISIRNDGASTFSTTDLAAQLSAFGLPLRISVDNQGLAHGTYTWVLPPSLETRHDVLRLLLKQCAVPPDTHITLEFK